MKASLQNTFVPPAFSVRWCQTIESWETAGLMKLYQPFGVTFVTVRLTTLTAFIATDEIAMVLEYTVRNVELIILDQEPHTWGHMNVSADKTRTALSVGFVFNESTGWTNRPSPPDCQSYQPRSKVGLPYDRKLYYPREKRQPRSRSRRTAGASEPNNSSYRDRYSTTHTSTRPRSTEKTISTKPRSTVTNISTRPRSAVTTFSTRPQSTVTPTATRPQPSYDYCSRN